MILNTDDLVFDKETYLEQIQKLAGKAKQERRLLKSSPVVEGLDLFTILSNADLITEKIISKLKAENITLEQSKMIELTTAPGKVRKIDILPWPEKLLLMGFQRTLADAFEPLFSKRLYSFIKKRSNLQAKVILSDFLKANKKCWLAKRDISGYGDNIKKDILLEKISKYLDTTTNPVSYKLINYAVGEKPVGIPTGSPLTPLFENIYLMELDQLSEKYPSSSLFYARYGDDFVFASPSKEIFEEFDIKANEIIDRLSLFVAPHKKLNILLQSAEQSFDWLGSKFSHNGLIGTRQKHVLQFKANYGTKIKKLILRLSRTKKIEEALPIISHALETYLSHRSNGGLNTLVFHRSDPRDTKDLDRQIRNLLSGWIRKYFKLNKKMAWKHVRSLKLKSLNFQRRKLCRLRKYRE